MHLGFEDEQITDKYKAVVNFTINKVGGEPVSLSYVRLFSYKIDNDQVIEI